MSSNSYKREKLIEDVAATRDALTRGKEISPQDAVRLCEALLFVLDIIRTPEEKVGRPPAHRMQRSKVYRAWLGMKTRCLSPKRSVPEYKKRGMFSGWIDSFDAFYKEIGDPPSPSHQVDRIDNAEGYFPGNVRWATPREQSQNRCSTIFFELNGKKLSMSEWARGLGLTTQALSLRLKKGWSLGRALTEKKNKPEDRPSRTDRKLVDSAVKLRAEGRSWRQIAIALNLPVSTVASVVRRAEETQ